MSRPASVVLVLIGLALTVPATSQAQSHHHSHHGCGSCAKTMHARSHPDCPTCSGSKVPVVYERRGLLGRLFGKTRVVIPAGHFAEHETPVVPPPVAHWNGASPSADHVLAGSGHAVAHGAPTAYPSALARTSASDASVHQAQGGGPTPIGVMRTNYAPTPTAHSAYPSAAAHPAPMPTAHSGYPSATAHPAPTAAPMPDPGIWAWHAYNLPESNAKPSLMERVLELPKLPGDMFQAWRARRMYKSAARQGLYDPTLREVPRAAVLGQ